MDKVNYELDNNPQEIQAVNLVASISYISRYCHGLQSCNNCIIKQWCKEQRKKCPEEWRNKICQEIDTQVVDQDKKN